MFLKISPRYQKFNVSWKLTAPHKPNLNGGGGGIGLLGGMEDGGMDIKVGTGSKLIVVGEDNIVIVWDMLVSVDGDIKIGKEF